MQITRLQRNGARTVQEKCAEAASARDLRRRVLRRRSKLNKVAINGLVVIMNSCNKQ